MGALINLDDLFYWVRGRRLPIRDLERTQKIQTIEYIASHLRGGRLALLEAFAQLLDDDHVMEILLRDFGEDEDSGRDYLRPRQADVRRSVGRIRRELALAESTNPRRHEPEVLGRRDAPWRSSKGGG